MCDKLKYHFMTPGVVRMFPLLTEKIQNYLSCINPASIEQGGARLTFAGHRNKFRGLAARYADMECLRRIRRAGLVQHSLARIVGGRARLGFTG